jgi:hypothetical protein
VEASKKGEHDVEYASLSIIALAVGIAASIAGGALGGIAVGGKALGNRLAAFRGAFYGPLAGGTGVLIGLVVLALIG